MHHPFQKIAIVAPGGKPYLLAACGSILLAVNLSEGSIASQWRQDQSHSNPVAHDDDARNEPPSKKRKPNTTPKASNIICLSVTSDGNYAALVTGEDKCVRVFSISEQGVLRQLSQRAMPKRPSAITLLQQNQDAIQVLVADKFGDVYAIPLLSDPEADEIAKQAAQTALKVYKPKADPTTVHSKANMKSLESQLRYAEEQVIQKTKEHLPFEHKFLLGHVSMLIDITTATVPTETGNRQRSYVITADRDEHIRISRGPPQSHVIESFCLEHENLVTRLLVVDAEVLVSGGGDDYICVWNWPKAELISKISLRSALAQASNHPDDSGKVTLSGLKIIKQGSKTKLLISCENVAALFYCDVDLLRSSEAPIDVISLDANILDFAVYEDLVLLSTGTTQSPSAERIDPSQSKARLRGLDLNHAKDSEKVSFLDSKLIDINGIITEDWHEKELQTLSYPLESLRKRGNEVDE